MSLDETRLESLAALGGDISEMVKELRELRSRTSTPTTPPDSPLRIGNNVFIRTVTYHHTGHIAAMNDDEVILTDAAWIADSGRWATALKTGKLNEVEPFPFAVTVMRSAIVDVSDWTHPLPREQK